MAGRDGPCKSVDQAAGAAERASRLRATSAAAAAPNNSTIGGAGTGVGVPPVDPVMPLLVIPLLEVDPLDDVLELVLLDADEVMLPLELVEVEEETFPLELLDVDVDDDTLPLEEDETSPLEEAEDDTLPLLPPLADEMLPLLDEPPVDDETLPLLDDPPVDEPPVDDVLVLEKPPLLVEEPPLPPDEVEVDPPLLLVDPPVDVDDTTMLPPLPPPLPPKKPPAKKPPPPPKPPPKPELPTSTAPPLPLLPVIGYSPAGAAVKGTGTPWLATVTTAGAHLVSVTTRRTVVTRRFLIWRAACLRSPLTMVLAMTRSAFARDSVTCTAPPPMTAPPHAQAHSLAKAIRTDMGSLSCHGDDPLAKPGSAASRHGNQCKRNK